LRWTWYAVRTAGDELVFQTGGRVWSFDDSGLKWTVAAHGHNRRMFRVQRGSEIEFEISYRDPSASYWARNDPTRDALDEQADDMFLWVEEISRSARMRGDLIRVWGVT